MTNSCLRECPSAYGKQVLGAYQPVFFGRMGSLTKAGAPTLMSSFWGCSDALMPSAQEWR